MKNSGRSQMAEAFFNALSKRGNAISAGVNPDKEIHPWTVELMKDAGIDISGNKPKPLTEKMMKKADIIVVMHPSIARNIPLKYLEKLKVWRIDSLLGKSKDDVVIIRDRIKEMVKHLINEMKG